MDIIDKHRVLMAVGIRPSGYTAPPAARENLLQYLRETTGCEPPSDFDNVFFAIVPVSVVKAGDEIPVPKPEVNQNMDFAFDVALNETEVIEIYPRRVKKLVEYRPSLLEYEFLRATTFRGFGDYRDPQSQTKTGVA